ncbi:MAG: hypothetical protein ACK5PR_01720, partial [bacterium]
YLLSAGTPEGAEWLQDNVADIYAIQGGALPCESVLAQGIAAAALSEGYSVALNNQELTL